ncbi:cytidylate kinase [uncultured Eubacteriales bacterium]|uniref:Cytidylate kinase n=1 Tax=uncultured Eubacteriales bacterium TaxID=172733 RepID=A0A212JYN8_9FIRM|nr:cytidylate kinase [uncultured Eubacteriales bacterium]
MKYKSIAIDGPSGAGKSTLAKLLAEELGFLYVDTGAIYRTVGLCAFRQGVEPTDAAAVTDLLGGIAVDLRYGDDGLQHMFLNGEDVTGEIRRHEISRYASAVSAIPAVRAFLLQMQRDMAERQNVVMDGRDIGTVVLPDADVKIFLTATPEDRAERRQAELLARGQACDFGTVLADIVERDRNDSSRAAAPLRMAEDAVLVDTTGNSLEQSFCGLLQVIKEKVEV